MLSRVNEKKIDDLTVRELEELLQRKKGNVTIAELMKERDRLRLEIRRIDDQIELIERSDPGGGAKPRQAASQMDESLSSTTSARGVAEEGVAHSFLAGKRKNNLKDYIAQVLLQARGPLSASEIQRELPGVGYMSSSTNPRSSTTPFSRRCSVTIFSSRRERNIVSAMKLFGRTECGRFFLRRRPG